jgi:uncharacterized protein YqeY
MFQSVSELRKEMMMRKKVNQKEAQMLTMLLDETLKVAKADGNREADVKDITTAVKKMVKQAEQAKALNVEGAQEELDFLEQYRPKLLSEDETRAIVVEAKATHGINIGAIMKEIKSAHGDLIDMKLVNQLLKES